ncbi:LuxR C-terminal-related transcriptional regulator [Mycolicibacterium mucogenicum]|uniref:LuxR C-terminal-related transcriptional regulator n=1 Tax=Mycolicibacterium mucogenicum TaxID=56689 RepID=UPI002269B5DB|nr:LuxR C-terminal-related transcriptional regulator [Mycolicibacterium mucogenicum]MCX8559215.1 LuxR C-terminal-related transcriptional regulator [Mycolicibacterium mucogenicum]
MKSDERDWGTCDGDEEFDQLIEQSSLGTVGARQLRGRVSDVEVQRVRDHLPDETPVASDDSAPRRVSLSERERQVLTAWFETEDKELVAARLSMSTGLVAAHLQRVRTKYASAGRPVRSTAALVQRAIIDGLISIEGL